EVGRGPGGLKGNPRDPSVEGNRARGRTGHAKSIGYREGWAAARPAVNVIELQEAAICREVDVTRAGESAVGRFKNSAAAELRRFRLVCCRTRLLTTCQYNVRRRRSAHAIAQKEARMRRLVVGGVLPGGG